MSRVTLPVQQIAYYVTDVVAAAQAHEQQYGSGPFFLVEHVQVRDFVYRGQALEYDHSATFGQWGDVMVEFFTQHNSGSSYAHDMFPHNSGMTGMHHIASIVENPRQVVEYFATLDCEVASSFRAGETGIEVTFIDTRRLCGHMVELYRADPVIFGLYDMVRGASEGYDGNAPITKL